MTSPFRWGACGLVRTVAYDCADVLDSNGWFGDVCMVVVFSTGVGLFCALRSPGFVFVCCSFHVFCVVAASLLRCRGGRVDWNIHRVWPVRTSLFLSLRLPFALSVVVDCFLLEKSFLWTALTAGAGLAGEAVCVRQQGDFVCSLPRFCVIYLWTIAPTAGSKEREEPYLSLLQFPRSLYFFAHEKSRLPPRNAVSPGFNNRSRRSGARHRGRRNLRRARGG